ncbi:NAD dependent epimerase/dehydratase [Butyrivibrio proteoclasticus B316]|uniref:NAD dependent epimerase/dehydratase n=1 Tax=Butyrivibrio proteoclasticus (strain ATCC 51982 / DSM 14932 / B316) TaxID=515622 RepID=E0RVX8_BUTPB|nr:SDR family oxidoreductase [Butyrivibrio proteoclasticus]ADL35660.1 NAD dependent epimerase/dehydratase [Butyrivibrio proteoclasticus B316]
MKVVLAGAFGNLGADIFRSLVKEGHEVVALDMMTRDIGVDEKAYTFKKVDVTKPETLKGTCDGADVVITTVGLTKGSATVSNYDIDYQGNLNILNEAKAAGVKRFTYISVIKADKAPKVPMLHAKYLFEEELKKSGLTYVIHRPTGYFYDIVKVFRPMIEKGEVTLLGKKPVHANVISTEDFGEFIVKHMLDDNKSYNVGGKETYSYEEIANMCFEAAGKTPVIKRAPAWLFDVLAFVNKLKKNGKEAILRFSKWTLTEEMVGDTTYGEMSFKQYIKDNFTK